MYATLTKILQDEKLYFTPEAFDTHTITNDQGKTVKVTSNIHNIINNDTCFDNGYSLIIYNRQSWTHGSKIFLRCEKRSLDSRVSRAKKQKTHTKCASAKADRCKFQLTVYYDKRIQRFFIRKNSTAHFEHHMHPPVERELRTVAANQVPAHQLDLVIEMLHKNCPTPTANLLLEIMGNNKLSRGSLDYLRRSVLISKHGNASAESTAITLFRLLEKKGVPFIYFSASYSEAMSKITFYKRSCKKKRKHKKKSANQLLFDPLLNESESDLVQNEETFQSTDQEAMNYVEAVTKALSIGDGEVLLAIMWATPDGRLSHRRYPHILGMDVTYGTNNERRPLFRVIGKNARNKNFPIADAFIPSQQRYVLSSVVLRIRTLTQIACCVYEHIHKSLALSRCTYLQFSYLHFFSLM